MTTPIPSDASPLAGAQLVGFAATVDGGRARVFYEGALGLKVLSDDPMAITLETSGNTIRIQKLKTHTPQSFTILGWNVDHLDSTLDKLAAHGVAGERFPGLPQNDKGVMEFPDGTRLVWLKDPDGNILSIAQMPK